MSEWISVDTELPENGDWYLVNQRYFSQQEDKLVSIVTMAFKDGAVWLSIGCEGDIDPDEITHWQPLPPPKQ